MTEKLNRNTYLSKHVGDFPEKAEVMGREFVKVDDLRYGTNPHQTAAFYKPVGRNCVIGDMQVLKTANPASPRPIWKTSPSPSTSSNSSTFPPARA